ncbi:hypothetical protein CRUP_012497, partial [Coryphaenoides rupestris]
MNPAHGPGKVPNMGPSGWGGPPPSSPPMDNGTAAWGKTTDTPATWADPGEGGAKTSGWGNPSANPITPGVKSMQDGWGEGESSVAASPGKMRKKEEEEGEVEEEEEEEEEGEGGGWWWYGSGSSWGQGSNGGWGHGPKKPSNKGPQKGPGDSWMNPLNRQFSNMGLMKMEAEKRTMGMNDFNGDMRKGVRGGSMPYRSPGPKEAGQGEAGTYYDKGSHSMFGLGGGGVAQTRHPPVNPSPAIRAQHQFLSPQVPGSMLKQLPPPSGGVGGVSGVGGSVFPPQLSPQQLAMLSSIYPPHIQFQLLLLQQQQNPQQLLQNQRKFPQNFQRQQTDPQQLARVMAMLRQQQATGVGGLGGGSKLSPSHLGVGVAGPKLPGVEALGHAGLGGSVADMHPKAHGGYS